MAVTLDSNKLKVLLHEWSADLVGFADLKGLLPDELAELSSGISLGVKLSEPVMEGIVSSPTLIYYHHYETVNRYLDDLALRVTLLLERSGYKALPVPASQLVNEINLSGIISHKMVASRSGLGWIGKNGLLVTERFGPRLRLVSVLTNLKVTYDKPVSESFCGKCHICASSCPAGAIHGNNWTPGISRENILDANRCEEWKRSNYTHIGAGRVCGICIAVCPKGKKSRV